MCAVSNPSTCAYLHKIEMALTRFFMSSTSILLLSLLVIASATDYEYAPKPDYGQPKPQDHKPLPTEQPDYGKPKPQGNDKHSTLPTKPDYDDQKPKPNQGNDKLPSLPTKPDYEKEDSKGKDELLTKVIGIQGLVLCKLGSKYVPLKGNMSTSIINMFAYLNIRVLLLI